MYSYADAKEDIVNGDWSLKEDNSTTPVCFSEGWGLGNDRHKLLLYVYDVKIRFSPNIKRPESIRWCDLEFEVETIAEAFMYEKWFKEMRTMLVSL